MMQSGLAGTLFGLVYVVILVYILVHLILALLFALGEYMKKMFQVRRPHNHFNFSFSFPRTPPSIHS